MKHGQKHPLAQQFNMASVIFGLAHVMGCRLEVATASTQRVDCQGLFVSVRRRARVLGSGVPTTCFKQNLPANIYIDDGGGTCSKEFGLSWARIVLEATDFLPTYNLQ